MRMKPSSTSAVMRAFAGKEVVLCVTGSIAAYKACEIASKLAQAGCRVTTAMTRSAMELVGPATFEAVTGQRAITAMFAPLANPEIEHIAVAKRADLFLVAPATANILAKAAHGIADDWISTTLLATRAPILFAPAMNTQMYTHPATQENLRVLAARGCHFVGPGEGALACGDVGPGRLIELPAIYEAAAACLRAEKPLAGKHVLITSGGNHEPIDPVRYIGNRSSGKMGYALALEALCLGARVTVVSGPAEVPPPHGADVVWVETAREMLGAVAERIDSTDVFIAAAAVADYRSADETKAKHKRTGAGLTLRLGENPDIAAAMGARKRAGTVHVGFAAETDDLLENARGKMERKRFDVLVANRVGGDDCAFGADAVVGYILTGSAEPESLEATGKSEVAARVLARVAKLLA